jgi:hypothetical protein
MDFDRPVFFSCGGIQRDKLAICGRHVDPIAVQRDAAIGRMQLKQVIGILLHIPPQLSAGLGIQRDHIIPGCRDEHPSVIHDRRRLMRLN